MTKSARQKMEELVKDLAGHKVSWKEGFSAGYTTRSEEVAETLKAVMAKFNDALQIVSKSTDRTDATVAVSKCYLEALLLLDSLDKAGE